MNLLASPTGRKILFAALYFSEGAPIGFLWLALPTKLKADAVDLEKITWLTGILVLPWAFKFLWAPLVDFARNDRWSFKHWITAAQLMMIASLIPLVDKNPAETFGLLTVCLLCHAFAAATQDVSIDAFCISVVQPSERGQLNGWMQVGMSLGKAAMGGGALILFDWIGFGNVIYLLFACAIIPMFLLHFGTRNELPRQPVRQASKSSAMLEIASRLTSALRFRNTWLAVAFALLGGAAFKSFEIIWGPMLIDAGVQQANIGWFASLPWIVSMVVGSLIGGYASDRYHRPAVVGGFAATTVASIAWMGYLVHLNPTHPTAAWWFTLGAIAFSIGLLTASSYALFMDLTWPPTAATQFSGYMGATNGCESWSSIAIGIVIAERGYAVGIWSMCAVSILVIPLLIFMRVPQSKAV